MATTAGHNPPAERHPRLPIFAFATTVVAGIVGVAFALGWLIGRILL